MTTRVCFDQLRAEQNAASSNRKPNDRVPKRMIGCPSSKNCVVGVDSRSAGQLGLMGALIGCDKSLDRFEAMQIDGFRKIGLMVLAGSTCFFRFSLPNICWRVKITDQTCPAGRQACPRFCFNTRLRADHVEYLKWFEIASSWHVACACRCLSRSVIYG